jgi:hypothetical protein
MGGATDGLHFVLFVSMLMVVVVEVVVMWLPVFSTTGKTEAIVC